MERAMPSAGSGEAEVMASIDATAASERFIIADITRDEAWLSVRRAEAPLLANWC